MKRFDMHIHLEPPYRSAQDDSLAQEALKNLAEAGLDGGCIFSPNPKDRDQRFIPYQQRMDALLAYTRGHEDRLFPVFWVHPDAPDAQEHILDAAKKGVKITNTSKTENIVMLKHFAENPDLKL